MEILADGTITSPQGFLAGATYCGIKKRQVPDLALVYSTQPCVVGATFTTNQVKSEALLLAQQHVQNGSAQAIIANSGNANACTGVEGREAAAEMARLAAAKLELRPGDVIVASTGIIGVRLPIEKIRAGLQALQIRPDGGHDAAQGIMTTDRFPKETAVRVTVDGRSVTIGGIAKGAGMIHPNMATMFGFITTDIAIDRGLLQELTSQAVSQSFNMIDVDGDTSPSDTVCVLANGLAANRPLRPSTVDASIFAEGLNHVCRTLAKEMVRDGEGATKVVEVRVAGAVNDAEARVAARAIASSNLVKAAAHGSDPNWGRILCAAGYSGAQVDQMRADIAVGDVALMVGGEIAPFDPKVASAALRDNEVVIKVDLHLGNGRATAWGSDLTEEYVRFNAKYTT